MKIWFPSSSTQLLGSTHPTSQHRHHHSRHHSTSSATHPTTTTTAPHPPSNRRAHSVEDLPTTANDTSTCSHCSCSSQIPPPYASTHSEHAFSGTVLRGQSSSCGELPNSFCKSNKENVPVISGSKTRTAISDSWSIIGSQRGKSDPFQDRTNVQPSGGGSLGKRSVSTANGEERRASLKELVPPLNAARLRPIRQQTRSAIVSQPTPLTQFRPH